MRESIKAVLSLVLIICGVVALFVWTEDRPDSTTWMVRIGLVVIALIALITLLKLHFRRDLVPDHLTPVVGTYFQRDGFGFGFATESENGFCLLNLYFQNSFERPCRGRVALRPSQGFFLGRAKFASVRFDVDCGPGAFGVARLRLPIPAKMQGKSQYFEVGASVTYPQGRGRRLRFRDGILIRKNSDFGDAFATTLTAVGALGGAIVLTQPAKVKLTLPASVAEEVPEGERAEVTTLWTLNDAPMKDAKVGMADELI